jgi:hypothetical protein
MVGFIYSLVTCDTGVARALLEDAQSPARYDGRWRVSAQREVHVMVVRTRARGKEGL